MLIFCCFESLLNSSWLSCWWHYYSLMWVIIPIIIPFTVKSMVVISCISSPLQHYVSIGVTWKPELCCAEHSINILMLHCLSDRDDPKRVFPWQHLQGVADNYKQSTNRQISGHWIGQRGRFLSSGVVSLFKRCLALQHHVTQLRRFCQKDKEELSL